MQEYRVCGMVERGHGIGRLVGLPTANLRWDQGCELPPCGVYEAEMVWRGRNYAGIACVGTRPTLGGSKLCVDVHLFRFNGELRGQRVWMRFSSRLRDVRRFGELSMLLAQIHMDCEYAGAPKRGKTDPEHVRLWPHQRMIEIEGRRTALSQREYGVISLLYANPGSVFSKQQIYELVWQCDVNGCVHAVENTVYQLRRKMAAYGDAGNLIATVPGRGYCFRDGKKG